MLKCLAAPNLEGPQRFTRERLLRLPPGLQKEFLVAHCYSPYVYRCPADCPGGEDHDGQEDGRYFLVQPSVSSEVWGIWEYVRLSHEGEKRYYGTQVFLLSEHDLWDRVRREGFLAKWQRAEFFFDGFIMSLNTTLCRYGPGSLADVLITAIVDTKWLAADSPPARETGPVFAHAA